MFFDPAYLLMVVLPALILSGGASLLVKSAFNKYSRIGSRHNMSGAEAARRLLDRAGIDDVEIVRVPGSLSDHYDPVHKRLALSEPVHDSRSIAAIGVATHEAGHAIQHATGYAPLKMRSAIVPVAHIGSSIGMLAMMIGLALMYVSPIGQWILVVGVVLFAGMLLFQLVTLPVEFNASRRAKRLVVESGIIDPDEREGIDRVLGAAALTYVAAAISTALTLLYFLWRSGLLGGRD